MVKIDETRTLHLYAMERKLLLERVEEILKDSHLSFRSVNVERIDVPTGRDDEKCPVFHAILIVDFKPYVYPDRRPESDYNEFPQETLQSWARSWTTSNF